MTFEELVARKKALGYTNKMISDLSGVPLGTVNKIFSGATGAPRFDTLRAIENVLMERRFQKEKGQFVYNYTEPDTSTLRVEESVLASFYGTHKGPGQYTVEDFFALPDDHRVELIEGNFYDMAPPNLYHQNAVLSMAFLFSECIEAHPEKDCMLFISPVGVKLGPDNKTMVEPDLVIFCDKELLQEPDYISGAPDLLVEVLSPSNRDHDTVFKLMIYRKYGVKEYWIIDPDKEQVLVYDLLGKDLPHSYSFEEKVPIGIFDGECSIDFTRVAAKLHRLKDKLRS